jgi:hypothetical protein
VRQPPHTQPRPGSTTLTTVCSKSCALFFLQRRSDVQVQYLVHDFAGASCSWGTAVLEDRMCVCLWFSARSRRASPTDFFLEVPVNLDA